MKEIITDVFSGLIFLIGIFCAIGLTSLIYWAWNSDRKNKNRSE